MPLFSVIEQDLRNAILSKDEVKVRTLRMLKSDIMYEKARGTEDLTDDKVMEIIVRSSKKRKEAIEEYSKASRSDLVEKENEELKIIETYLPKQLDINEIEGIVDRKITEMGGIGKKDFGRIMGSVMKEFKGQVDGNIVKEILTRKMENQ